MERVDRRVGEGKWGGRGGTGGGGGRDRVKTAFGKVRAVKGGGGRG